MSRLKEIGWQYGLKDIEDQIMKYGGTNSSGIEIAYYPTINSFTSIEAYNSYVNALITSVRKDLSVSRKNLETLTMAFKFSDTDKLKEVNFVLFLYALILWRPYIASGIKVTEKDFFMPEVFNNKKYNEYLNNFQDKYCYKFTAAEYSEILHDIQDDMSKMVKSVGSLLGNSLSIYDLAKLARRYKEVNDIFHTEIDLENFQVSEAEEFIIAQTERLLQIMLHGEDKNNPLKAFIRAGTGVNAHQVKESFVHLAFKPDFEGDTIPKTTNSNLMTEGLKTPESIFVDSKGGRKAAVLQRGVSEAGYYSRHGSFVTSDVTLHEDPTYSCNTVNLVKFKVETQRDLESLIGRFYKVGDKRYQVISKADTYLKGTTIELRSPVTCANKEGKICKACYGTLYNVNYGMHAGRYAAIDTSESRTQLGLSARHALATNSAEISIYDERQFLLNTNGWLFRLNDKIDVKRYELVFNQLDMMIENSDNYDQYDNYYFKQLTFRNIKSGEVFTVYEEKELSLYLSKQLYQLLRDRKFFTLEIEEDVTIPLTDIVTSEPFVFLRINNNELTKPIKELTKFIQKGEKPLKKIGDYHEYISQLNILFRQGGMNIPSVHIEMIIRNLIRDKEDDLYIPDWSITQEPEMYKMVSMNKAILLNQSVISSLMFEKVADQLKNPKTYRKTGSSVYSLMFINE